MNSPLRRALYRAIRSPQFIIGAALVTLFVLTAVLGPILSPYSPTAQKMSLRLKPPSAEHVLGTDDFGRDVLSRILHGAMPSLQVSVLSVAGSLVIGVIIGLIAGYRGGWTDTLLMSLMDVLLAFPAVLLAIAILAVMGTALSNVILAIAIVNLPTFARLARGSTLATRELLYVEAARSLGVPPIAIMWRHILPNIAAPLIVQTSLTIAAAILIEAALSYLGLGIQPPAPSWGNILSSTYGFIQTNPWPSVFAGAAIALAVLGFNLLGDGLRDALDPTTR
ncbi:MAG: ABC transporter permease [Candidatus Roseilinea sp.]|nr:MAG: ABC transporter permease [Candidatus Roseilinea sp.]GIV84693.1 MAG: ABC transporter permease [Candidatus Roseilinea sp.]